MISFLAVRRRPEVVITPFTGLFSNGDHLFEYIFTVVFLHLQQVRPF